MCPGIDPSKLEPKFIAEMTELMRTLPHEQVMKMQTIMHNSMAGFDVSKDVREFEQSLSPDFRMKLARLVQQANLSVPGEQYSPASPPAAPTKPVETIDDARLMVLRAVRDGSISPEEALKTLFPGIERDSSAVSDSENT